MKAGEVAFYAIIAAAAIGLVLVLWAMSTGALNGLT